MKTKREIWIWVTALMAAVLLVGACVKTHNPDGKGSADDGWTIVGDNVPISFAAKIAGDVETKTSSPLPTSTNFRVFCFYQPGVVDDDPAVDYVGTWDDLSINHWTPNFMFDQAVTRNDNGTPADDTDDYWGYSPVKYWPNNQENTLTFWAYSPYYGDEDILKLYKTNSDDDYASDVPGTPEAQFTTDGTRDLLVSDLAQDLSYRGGDPSTVTLQFHHTTSWIDFRVKKVDDSDDYDIVLLSITLEDICNTAVYSLSGWGGAWNRVDFTAYDCDDDINDDGTELDKDEEDRITFPAGGNKLLLIPQALRNTTANLKVVYTFHEKGAGGSPTEYEENVLLGSLTTRWEEGKHYTYKVNISPGNPILFTTYVGAWDSEQNGYFNVN